MNLDDLRRHVPVEDPAAYADAYAEATIAGSLGVALHRLRVEAGLSAGALAERLGVDEDAVERAEEGDPALTVAFVARVARVLGAPLTVVIGGEAVAGTGEVGEPDARDQGADDQGATPGVDAPQEPGG